MTAPTDTKAEDEAIRAFLSSVEGFAQTDVATRIGNFRGMVYGNDGTGKTIAGLTLLNYIVPPEKTVLLVDTSENWLSINNHPYLKTSLSDGSPRIIRYPAPVRGLEPWLSAMASTIRRKVPPFDKVGGVQFDEFSGIADSLLSRILEVAEELDKSRPKDDATWPEYKQLLRKMKKILEVYSSLEGVHVMTTAHFRLDPTGRGVPMESPNFTPGVGREIRKPMHLIANLTVDEQGNRIFQLQPDKTHLAKCKIGGLGTHATAETLFPQIKRWINGEVESAQEPTVIPSGVPANTHGEAEPSDEGWEIA